MLPISRDYDGAQADHATQNGRRMFTPMLIVMIAIGTTDLIFALDSIPAIFGLTKEPYLVFTANVFALMGLRQLYFLLGGLLDRLIYLCYGLAVVLGFIGVKLVLEALPTTTCRSSTAASRSAGPRTSRSGSRCRSSSAPWPWPPWRAWSSRPGTGGRELAEARR